jgi:uncharacterized membrane protein
MTIFQKLKNINRLTSTKLLVAMSVFSLLLSIFRIYYTQSSMYIFLNWNLFLACIPWAVTTYILINANIRQQKSALWLGLFIWILFFPNSPYILTDLFHLKERNTVPIWFDLVLILSYAWTGLLFGFLSLLDLEKLISLSLKPYLTNIIIVTLLFLAGFGIYLGRFLRWNSWDIIQNPTALLNDVFDRVINPTDHLRTWSVTLLMGILLNMMYWSIKLFKQAHIEVKPHPIINK